MNLPDKLSIMFVGGHPHDAIAQAGGTLALHARRGDKVTAVVLTHGGNTHTGRYKDEVKRGLATLSEDNLTAAASAMREQMREACAVLGFTDLRFLETRDDIVLLDIN